MRIQIYKQVKPNNSFKSKNGCTLAEVLLVITIIGVIASLTIPNLIADINKSILYNSFMVSSQTFFTASSEVYSDYENNISGIFTSPEEIRDAYKTHLNIIKSCDTGDSFGNCWHDNGMVFNLPNTLPVPFDNGPSLVLGNGMTILFATDPTMFSTNCNLNGVIEQCAEFYVDVNGYKKPNVFGRDVFQFYMTKNYVHLWGDELSHSLAGDVFCDPANDSTGGWDGAACGAKITTAGKIYY